MEYSQELNFARGEEHLLFVCPPSKMEKFLKWSRHIVGDKALFSPFVIGKKRTRHSRAGRPFTSFLFKGMIWVDVESCYSLSCDPQLLAYSAKQFLFNGQYRSFKQQELSSIITPPQGRPRMKLAKGDRVKLNDEASPFFGYGTFEVLGTSGDQVILDGVFRISVHFAFLDRA